MEAELESMGRDFLISELRRLRERDVLEREFGDSLDKFIEILQPRPGQTLGDRARELRSELADLRQVVSLYKASEENYKELCREAADEIWRQCPAHLLAKNPVYERLRKAGGET